MRLRAGPLGGFPVDAFREILRGPQSQRRHLAGCVGNAMSLPVLQAVIRSALLAAGLPR